MSNHVIAWGGEEARIGPWRGDARVAFLSPLGGGRTPSVAFLRRCLDLLAARGFTGVVTGALGPMEQAGFLSAGFRVEKDLCVLEHDLQPPPVPGRAKALRGSVQSSPRLRRGRRSDRPELLTLDAAAFSAFWQLDEEALEDALTATPRVRFRVAAGEGGATGGTVLDGYAVTGRAGRVGYLQRLAVHPACQGAGVGSALVLDALRWLKRRHVDRLFVNTQPDNRPALRLYQALGFRPSRSSLSVLSAGLQR